MGACTSLAVLFLQKGGRETPFEASGNVHLDRVVLTDWSTVQLSHFLFPFRLERGKGEERRLVSLDRQEIGERRAQGVPVVNSNSNIFRVDMVRD